MGKAADRQPAPTGGRVKIKRGVFPANRHDLADRRGPSAQDTYDPPGYHNGGHRVGPCPTLDDYEGTWTR